MASAIGSALGGVGSLFTLGSQKRLMDAQTQGINQQTSLSRLMGGMAQQQFNLAEPAYGSALSYYDTLLKGNRAAQMQAVAPQAENLQDVYAGAQRGLDRLGVRGGEAATAKADMLRQLAGQVGNLTTGVQSGAAEKLGSLGSTGVSQAGSLASGAAGAAGGAASNANQGLYTGLYGSNMARNNIFGIGQDLGKMFFPQLLNPSSGDGGGWSSLMNFFRGGKNPSAGGGGVAGDFSNWQQSGIG